MYQPPPSYNNYGVPSTPIGSIWSQTIQLLRRFPSVFMGLAALEIIPQLLFAVYAEASGLSQRFETQYLQLVGELERRVQQATESGNSNVLTGFPWGLDYSAFQQFMLASIVLLLIQYFILRNLAIGGAVAAVGDAYSTERPSFGAAMSSGIRSLPALLGWGLISVSVFLLFAVTLLIPCLGVFIWAGVLIFLHIRLLLVPQVVVAEQQGLFSAIGRSWQLTRNRFWRFFGAWLLFSIVVTMGARVVTSLFNSVIVSITGTSHGFSLAATQAVATVVSLIATPIAYIAYTLLYYDGVRQEQQAPPPPPVYPTYPPYQ